MPRSSKTLLLGDGYGNYLVNDWGGPSSKYPYLPLGYMRLIYADVDNARTPPVSRIRHSGSNILFCDIHV